MNPSGTVHVIDDDAAMRDSLSFLLRASGLAVRDHASAKAFLAALPGLEVGCVVTDIRMPDVTGIDLLKALGTNRPGVPVIVITGHGDVALAVDAMKLGAVDFLEKPFGDEALLAAVEHALSRRHIDERRDTERAQINARIDLLSPRERDVLAGLVAGKQNKTIAYDLDISPRTVEVYRANLMTKMQAASLSQLVRMALLAGFAMSAEAGPQL
jgi:two-component system response regulator FixJ